MKDRAEVFRQKVYRLTQAIPEGLVITYGQLAQLAGEPCWVRQVGRALRDAPACLRLPWHRVVKAQGQIAQRQSKHGLMPGVHQVTRLKQEGVVFCSPKGGKASQRVSASCFWQPENDGLVLQALCLYEEEEGR